MLPFLSFHSVPLTFSDVVRTLLTPDAGIQLASGISAGFPLWSQPQLWWFHKQDRKYLGPGNLLLLPVPFIQRFFSKIGWERQPGGGQLLPHQVHIETTVEMETDGSVYFTILFLPYTNTSSFVNHSAQCVYCWSVSYNSCNVVTSPEHQEITSRGPATTYQRQTQYRVVLMLPRLPTDSL